MTLLGMEVSEEDKAEVLGQVPAENSVLACRLQEDDRDLSDTIRLFLIYQESNR